ncbi:MAG: class I SAM-dependent methyltransferase [Pseudolysinimonas sp.]
MVERTPGTLSAVQRVLRVAKRVTPLVPLARLNSRIARSLASAAHHFQLNVEWGVDNPEFFEHHLDQYYSWRRTRNSLPWERGVNSALALQATTAPTSKPTVLTLCCGDGFMDYYFYSLLAESIIAIDFDPDAIRVARRTNQAPNITYLLGDIRSDIPEGQFDNIVWDAAIEHFTQEETAALMGTIASRLKPDGILSGYTLLEKEDGHKHLHQHEYEFHDKEDLARFLTPYFATVQVWETVFPNRTNLYFYATNDKLPSERDLMIIERGGASTRRAR